MQRPRTFHRADYVVTALHDYAGDVTDARGVAQQLIVRFEESPVVEVVDLDASEGQCELVLFVVSGEGGVGQELRRGALPAASDLGGRQADGRVVAGQAAVVGGEPVGVV